MYASVRDCRSGTHIHENISQCLNSCFIRKVESRRSIPRQYISSDWSWRSSVWWPRSSCRIWQCWGAGDLHGYPPSIPGAPRSQIVNGETIMVILFIGFDPRDFLEGRWRYLINLPIFNNPSFISKRQAKKTSNII